MIRIKLNFPCKVSCYILANGTFFSLFSKCAAHVKCVHEVKETRPKRFPRTCLYEIDDTLMTLWTLWARNKMTKLVQGRRSCPTRDNKRREAISITFSHPGIDRSFVQRRTKTRGARRIHPFRAARLSPLTHSFQLVRTCAPCICTHAIQHTIHNALQIDRRTMINVDVVKHRGESRAFWMNASIDVE